MADLTTAAAVKTMYGIAGTSKDALLAVLVTQASGWVEKHCARVFGSTTHTELWSPGHEDDAWRMAGASQLLVATYPIISVTSVHQDAARAFGAATEIDSSNYWFDDYRIRLYEDAPVSAFATGRRTLKGIYVAGYATLPSDIVAAANMMTYHLFRAGDKQRQNVASVSMGGETIQYVNEAMPPEVKEILVPWIALEV